jgi:ERCC4-type nuclease
MTTRVVYPTITIDTREQVALSFPRCPSVRGTLAEGDYMIEGVPCVIERKSLADYLATITIGKERFERECGRLAKWRWVFIVVEADFSDVAEGKYRSNVHQESAIGLTAAHCIRHAPVFFASSHKHAGIIVERLLLMAAKQIEREAAGEA